MHAFAQWADQLNNILSKLSQDGALPTDIDASRVTVEPPRDPSHGDMSTNAAMVLAKQAGKPPRAIAEMICPNLQALPDVASVDIAGPGFVNLRLSDEYWQGKLKEILAAGTHYGDSDLGQSEKVNIEYVSANPTGPLHVGHTRGAVIGDALARLLSKAGYDVTKEYYINDAGAQIDVLARSAYLRYLEALGDDITIPEGLYPGDYLVPVGKALAEKYGEELKNMDEADYLPLVRDYASNAMMDLIREDLAMIGIEHDVFTSEKKLTQDGQVDKVVDLLMEKELAYVGTLPPPKGKKVEDWEEKELLLFKSSQFGDDEDRALKKSDGSWTYTTPDIAYHWNKVKRGFTQLIDVVGTDHIGWVKRITAATKAVSDGKANIDVKLCAIVNLLEDGKPVKMSKRAGTFTTMRDVIDKVGAGVVRFIMLTRRNDQVLDFDFKQVTEQSKDNPVFYVQYAHARCCSVLRHAGEMFAGEDFSASALSQADLSHLSSDAEMALIKLMASWPRIVESAASAHEAHRIAFYLYDLASAFHGLWNQGNEDTNLRFLHENDLQMTKAKLSLVKSVALVIASGLDIVGVTPLEEM